MISKIKECILQNKGKKGLRIHFSKLDVSIPIGMGANKIKNTVICGVFIGNELIETFELENYSDEDVRNFIVELSEFNEENKFFI